MRTQVEGAGSSIALLLRSGTALVAVPKRIRFILDQMFVVGVRPLPVTLFVAVFAGMILSLQTGIELRNTGTHTVIGNIIALSMCREMGPFITGVILAATVGSRMAAELGTMTVSEEITALEVMSIDPVRFLVMPRIVGLAIMCPILTVFANAVGILGGSIIAEVHLDISFAFYMNSVQESLTEQTGMFPKDVWVGIIKAIVFGIAIAVVGCSAGLRASGGALGVGQAVQSAVRNSILLIIVLGYIITWFFFYFLI
ncbi:MAG: ABC transporter permease [Planctomycetes bacterium]|nr:ABC transporter permease [Planctomycetota bacterium]